MIIIIIFENTASHKYLV